jgi:hypothetical protein
VKLYPASDGTLACGDPIEFTTLRWIQADIPQFMSEPLSANLLSVTESGQQKGAGR